MNRLFFFLAFVAFSVSNVLSANTLSSAANTFSPNDKSKIASLQIPFVKNIGQVNDDVKFYTKTFGGSLLVKDNGELVLTIPQTKSAKVQNLVISETFIGADIKSIKGASPDVTKVSYFLDNKPENWHSNVPTYKTVSLGEVYDDIELRLKAYNNNVEKLFYVSPGGNPGLIHVKVTGAEKLFVDEQGQLVLDTPAGAVQYTKPIAYQMFNGDRHEVDVAYALKDSGYGFALGEYNRAKELIIDPLIRASYMGGSDIEYAYNLAVHPVSGDVYVIGETNSTDFPDTTDAAQAALAGNKDVFVARFNANLTALMQVSYLGGTGDDLGFALTFHSSTGDIYLTGSTTSTDFPDAINANHGGRDIYIARLSEDLTTLQHALYVGDVRNDTGNALVYRTDPSDPTSGELYIAGSKGRLSSGSPDAVVLRYNDELDIKMGEVIIGGSGNDVGYDLAIDSGANLADLSDDKIYMVGYAGYNPSAGLPFSDFPVTSGVVQEAFGGQEDAFVARFNNTLSTTEAATFFGAGGIDHGHAIEVDSSGPSPTVYITGYFSPDSLPVFTGGAQEMPAGQQDAFVARLNADLSSLLAGSYYGGSSNDRAWGLQLGTTGDVYIAGVTGSSDLSGTVGGAQPNFGGGSNDSFITRFSTDLSSIGQASYFGGGAEDESWRGMVIHPANGNIYLAGETTSDDLSPTSGAPYSTRAGSWDGFIVTLDADLKGEAAADVSIVKSGSATVALNDVLSYTLTVANAGPDEASAVHVRDKLPEGVTVTSVNPGSCIVYGPGAVLDQEFDPSVLPPGTLEQHSAVSDISHKAQTFTVDLDGKLNEVSVYIYRGDAAVSVPLLVDVRATDSLGVPLENDTTVLASAVVNAMDVSTTPGFISVDISAANLDVVDGDVLAIVLRNDTVDPTMTASPYLWFGAGSKNLYADGKHFVRTPAYPTWTASEDIQATVPDSGFNSTVTTTYSVVECDLGTLASGASTLVEIDATAPGVDQIMINEAAVSAAEIDPDLLNNEDSLSTTVGTPEPDIAVSPLTYDYGSVNVATMTAEQVFTISNTGNWELTVDSISNSNATDFIAVVSGGSATCSPVRPFVLTAGQSCDITVAFRPSVSGALSANITIISDDPDENPVVVTLTGNGVSLGDIDVIPTSILFPDRVVGESVELGIGISNTGVGNLTVTGISKTETANPTNFIVVVSGGNATCSASLPFTLAPSANCILSMTFAPQSEGDHTASVTITSDDSDEGTINVPLSGTGVAAGSGGGGGGGLLLNPLYLLFMLIYMVYISGYLRNK